MTVVRNLRYLFLASFISLLLIFLYTTEEHTTLTRKYFEKQPGHQKTSEPSGDKLHHPKYLPTPTWTPPPIKDPFPLLATSTPPPIPEWNVPKPNLYKKYNLDYAPPLLIGFTTTWPLLLQAVVSYITAGWPASQIYIIENTGVQTANLEHKLTLQNPLYMNHKHLHALHVNIIQTPVLLSFAQLQNFYMHLARAHAWPYYFWSHMDVLALSHEAGLANATPPATEPGYRTLYELCLATLREAREGDARWANRFFAYDHLALVNREAYEDVGGWDTFIPYYMTDCDMHSRLLMRNWTQVDVNAGIITDVNTVLDDLLVLYRNTSLTPSFTDPNPAPPPTKRSPSTTPPASALDYWHLLHRTADAMWHHKHGARGRNTWQAGQRGGRDEPYFYPSRGLAAAVEVLTEAGREVFRRKWGHRDCDLIAGAGLDIGDQWRVKPDWK